jgi:hypothetical protein
MDEQMLVDALVVFVGRRGDADDMVVVLFDHNATVSTWTLRRGRIVDWTTAAGGEVDAAVAACWALEL